MSYNAFDDRIEQNLAGGAWNLCNWPQVKRHLIYCRNADDRGVGKLGMTDELERLYKSTYTAVVRFLYRKVWDADRAEDLAQEVFIRAMAHRPEKPRAWVFAVAANLARSIALRE